MTADFFPCDMSFLARTATGIINEVKGVNRVVYDVTSKPPGTIRVGVTSPLASGARICRRASVFKALGDKFCNFRGTPTKRRGGSTGPAGEIPRLSRPRTICWGSTLPRPYHFRARI